MITGGIKRTNNEILCEGGVLISIHCASIFRLECKHFTIINMAGAGDVAKVDGGS